MIAWYRQIDRAKSAFEVVAVVRDYFATWTPEDIGQLPEACRPGKVRDENDIESLHATLVEEYRTTRASGEELSLLQQLTSLLVRASMRLTELRGNAGKGGSSPPSSGPMKTAGQREN